MTGPTVDGLAGHRAHVGAPRAGPLEVGLQAADALVARGELLLELALALAQVVDRGRAGERLDAARAGAAWSPRRRSRRGRSRRCARRGCRRTAPSRSRRSTTTRTRSPYFSSKRPMAPSSAAAWRSTISQVTGWSSSTRALTIRSISRSVSGAIAAAVGEVEAQLVRAHVRAGLADALAERLAQRPAEDVGGGVVGLGRRRRGASTAREDLAADGELALVQAHAQHLVGAQRGRRR